MAGFPIRITRTALGPQFENAMKIVVPKYQRDAAMVNTELHQLVGMNYVSPMAWIELEWDTADLLVNDRREAWNPAAQLTAPYDLDSVSRASAGIYTVNYNAQYPDELGNLQTIDIVGGHGIVRDPTGDAYIYNVKVTRIDANTIGIRVHEWQIGTSTDWALVDKIVRVFWW